MPVVDVKTLIQNILQYHDHDQPFMFGAHSQNPGTFGNLWGSVVFEGVSAEMRGRPARNGPLSLVVLLIT